jgi:hypothetical protein
VGSYPSKGVVLHYYFAKLQLHSLAIRGLNPPANNHTFLSSERAEAANVAIYCAISAIRMFLDEQDIRTAMVGVPLFKHTMISFAAVFLLRVAWKWRAHLLVDPQQVSTLVQSLVDVMRSVDVNRRHLLWRLANGLADNLAKLKHELAREDTSSMHHQGPLVLQQYMTADSEALRPVSQTMAGAQEMERPTYTDVVARDIFDDLFAADGLSFAADEWLFTAPYDAYSSAQNNAWG